MESQLPSGYSKGSNNKGEKLLGFGGGIYINSWRPNNRASFEIRNSIIKYCVAEGKGAGLCFRGDKCIINNCRFIANVTKSDEKSSDAWGGAAYIQSYTTEIISTVCEKNNAVLGGAFTLKGVKADLLGCTFNENSAKSGGGAICFLGVMMNINSTECNGNYTNGGWGGVVYFRGQILQIDAMKAMKNSASGVGGAIDFEGDSAVVTKSQFANNVGGTSGGVVRFSGKKLMVSETKFQSNSAQRDDGGVLHFEGFKCELNKCLFDKNTANQSGGAITFRGQELTGNDLRFEKNSVKNGNGGAIDYQGDRCKFTNIEFAGNKTSEKGGAISFTGKMIDIDAVNFSNNMADEGGALFCDNDIGINPGKNNNYGLLISNSQFRVNKAVKSGGALSWMGKGIIKSSQFESNSAQRGGAIYGWIHQVNEKILFCRDSISIDSDRQIAEMDSSATARIIESSFIDNKAFEGRTCTGWPGCFTDCKFSCSPADSTINIKKNGERPINTNAIYYYLKVSNKNILKTQLPPSNVKGEYAKND